jgi:hypothetical protein
VTVGEAYFGPVPLWWWSGARLEASVLCEQLDQLLSQGVREAVVISLAPRGSLWGAPPDDPQFMSEQWWGIFLAVCQHAEDQGFGLWFYDQIGFSGADIPAQIVAEHPEDRGWTLESLAVDGDGWLEIDLPSRAVLVSSVSYTMVDGVPLEATTKVIPVDTTAQIRVPPTGENRRLVLTYAERAGYDYLSPSASSRLRDAIHGELERRAGRYFNRVIKGTFQDELPSMPGWSADFATEFRLRRGYQIEPHLPKLWDEIGENWRSVRRDYQRTRAELAEEAFFKPAFQWHEDRGLLVGCDQQHPARNGHLVAGVRYYADYGRTHRWFSAPGSDHWGDAKRHSSIAHAYGRPRTWIEAFHSTGWGGTLEETLDWLVPWVRAGANLYNPHAVYYSLAEGRFEWAPPSTCWRQPYWSHYANFVEVVSQLCKFAATGDHVCDVAVLEPVASVQQELEPFGPQRSIFAMDDSTTLPSAHAGRWPTAHELFHEIVGRLSWQDSRAGALDRLCLDFDVLDEASIQASLVNIGSFATLDNAHERYRTIILPAARALEPKTSDRLLQFLNAGGQLIAVGEPPSETAGLKEDSASVQLLAEAFRDGSAVLCETVAELEKFLEAGPRRVEAPVPTLLRRFDDESMAVLVPAASSTATTVVDSDDLYFRYSFDAARYGRRVDISVEGPFTSATTVAASGERRALKATRRGTRLDIAVAIDRAPYAIIELGFEGAPAVADPPSGEPGRQDIGGPWRAAAIPTLDNAHGDYPRIAGDVGAVPVQLWRMEARVGARDWRAARATYGVWAVRGPIVASAELPRPLSVADANEAANSGLRSGSGWLPVSYSLRFGPGDRPPGFPRLHDNRGYRSSDNIALGRVKADEGVAARATFLSSDGEYLLTVSAAADKVVWIDGVALEPQPGFHAQYVVPLNSGHHLIEFRLVARTAEVLSLNYSLVPHQGQPPATCWLGPPAGTAVGKLTTVVAAGSTDEVTLLLASVGPVTLRVNSNVIAEQGAFDNYEWLRMPRTGEYSTQLRAGENLIEVELADQDSRVLLDGLAVGSGLRFGTTARGWTQDGQDPLVDHRMFLDPSVLALSGPDHMTPSSSLVPLAVDRPEREGLRFVLPPGTAWLRIPAVGDGVATLGGTTHPIVDGVLEIPADSMAGTLVELELNPDSWRSGAALLEGPIEAVLQPGAGPARLGDWSTIGLGDFSGAVAYETDFDWSGAGAEPMIDLGAVRGTAEVFVNGRSCGVRSWAPYVLPVPELVVGRNSLRVIVRNTLAPYLAAVNPWSMVLPGQEACGLFGPVAMRFNRIPRPHTVGARTSDGEQ